MMKWFNNRIGWGAWIVLATVASGVDLAAAAGDCVMANQWLSPKTGQSLQLDQVLATAEGSRVIALGEHHGNAQHHVWQREMLAAIAESHPSVVVALEMLPRDQQETLKRFVSGDLSLERFVQEAGWDDYWSYSIELYAPVLEYIRERRIETMPVNIPRRWLESISQDGLDAVLQGPGTPPIQRPAVPPREYLLTLARSFESHRAPGSDASFSEERGRRFKRFVDVQLTWDRALAEGVKALLDTHPGSTVVLLAGTWHLVNGHGAVWQLRSLGVEAVTVLVPWDENLDCGELNSDFADAVYYPN